MALRDNELRSKMEPEVVGMPVELAAQASVAISLKRIADFICGTKGQMDMVAYLGREFGGDGK